VELIGSVSFNEEKVWGEPVVDYVHYIKKAMLQSLPVFKKLPIGGIYDTIC
jgi:hypothetical protein